MLIKHRILGNVSPEEVLINFTPNGGRRRMVGSPAEKWKVRMKRGAGRRGERLASEEHLLLHVPVTVPVSIRKHLTSYPGNPGRWAVVPFHS